MKEKKEEKKKKKKKKMISETLWKKVKLLTLSNFTFFHNSFYAIPLIATFQLSYAASLNLGRSQDGVLGQGLNIGQCRSNIRLCCSV